MKKVLGLRFDSAALFTVDLRRLVVADRFILPLLLIASAYPATAGGLIETWTAASTTASSITGDVRFSGDKITFQNGKSLPLQKVGSVTVGDFDGKAVPAMLYKVTKPANLELRMENKLCGRNPCHYKLGKASCRERVCYKV